MNSTSFRSRGKGLSARACRSHFCPDILYVLEQIKISLAFNLPPCSTDKAADSSCAFFVQQSSWCDNKAMLGAVWCQGLACAATRHLAELFSAMQNDHTQYFNNVHRHFRCRERLTSLIPLSHISQSYISIPTWSLVTSVSFCSLQTQNRWVLQPRDSCCVLQALGCCWCAIGSQPMVREDGSGSPTANWEISWVCHFSNI